MHIAIQEKLLSVREAAAFLGLKPSTVYKYRLYGAVPYVKIGARVLFDPERLRQWIAEHSHEPTVKAIP
jgi:excisionase family DNA binding protein